MCTIFINTFRGLNEKSGNSSLAWDDTSTGTPRESAVNGATMNDSRLTKQPQRLEPPSERNRRLGGPASVASPPLRKHCRGPEVAFLQLRLNALLPDAGLEVDGVFEEQTELTVRRLQASFGLPTTGVYDSPTAKLCLARCAALTLVGAVK